MKKFTYFLAATLSFVLWLGGLSPALAQSSPKPALGITSLYNNPEDQKQGYSVYHDILQYAVAIPAQEIPQGVPIPQTKEEFQKLLPGLVDKLGDGSVTKAWFDFQAAQAQTAGNELFSVNAPSGQKLYTVVAGDPALSCPLQIKDTQIAFFTDANKAIAKAKELDAKQYLVYVSPSKDLSAKALNALYDSYQSSGNQSCFIVDGATQQITVDFQNIFALLPPRLQQSARQQPFVFTPRRGQDNLYLVNARQTGSQLAGL
ncbi:chitinase/cellulase [Nostoc sp. NIES-2111]|nr:chitinase/cellulase [Nostoc sp. NIES-2111]